MIPVPWIAFTASLSIVVVTCVHALSSDKPLYIQISKTTIEDSHTYSTLYISDQ